MIIHEPKNYQKAEYFYAYLSQDADGMEGLIAVPGPTGVMPLAFTDLRIFEKFEPLAKAAIDMSSGKKLIKAKFKRVDE